jgi:hypothetical protein
LHSRLRSFQIWQSREAVDKSMPVPFGEMNPLTRVFIDCTEIFMENQIPLEVKVCDK